MEIGIELVSAIRGQQWTKVCDILDHDRELVQQLLTEDFDLLHEAVQHGAPADIITRLISPHNINMQDELGFTVLFWVVNKKRWELVPVLLQHGADFNLCDQQNTTPLLFAAYHAPADIITQLISPRNINMQDKDGRTVLQMALMRERWELVPVLIQHGADVNLCGNYINRTPLHFAAWYGAPADIITRLISHNINMQDNHGNTALHEAVSRRRWELVPVLLQYGADPSMLDSPRPDQPLVHLVPSLKAVCIGTIRSHMPVKSDAAYEGLRLPAKLVDEVKLRPQAEDIVNSCGLASGIQHGPP